MTFVLLDHQPKHGRWYAAADSRLTGEDGPILDSAPKLFSLPIKVYPTTDSPAFPLKPIFQHSFGIAYAGSSVSATSIYAFASTACQSLVLKEGGALPDLRDIADLIGRIAKHYIGEIWGRYHGSGERGRAELFAFGYCRVKKKLMAFRITPVIDPQFAIEVVELAGGPNAKYWLGPTSVKTAFLEQMTKHADLPIGERPTLATLLEFLIQSNKHKEIGGTVQTMIAEQSGAWVLPSLQSPDQSIRNAEATFLDVELKTIGPVGGCRIGIIADARRLKH